MKKQLIALCMAAGSMLFTFLDKKYNFDNDTSMAAGSMLFTSSVDVNVSQGTDQSVIASLTPAPASKEVDADVSVQLCFDEPLMPMRMPRSVTLAKLNDNTQNNGWLGKFFHRKRHGNRHERIGGSIDYDDATHCLSFKPDQNLSVGFYEVKTKRLMVRKPGRKMLIRPITYRFYVPEVINGFKLPPEPDEDQNNATLLGIDFNENGIRDDVERWIITHYAKDPKYPKTKTAIALQYAWASQKILENPTMESSKYEDNALACESYWSDKKTQGLSGLEYVHFRKKHKVFGAPELKDKIFNTKERILRKFDYNAALSGNILTLRKGELSACQRNIDELGE